MGGESGPAFPVGPVSHSLCDENSVSLGSSVSHALKHGHGLHGGWSPLSLLTTYKSQARWDRPCPYFPGGALGLHPQPSLQALPGLSSQSHST